MALAGANHAQNKNSAIADISAQCCAARAMRFFAVECELPVRLSQEESF